MSQAYRHGEERYQKANINAHCCNSEQCGMNKIYLGKFNYARNKIDDSKHDHNSEKCLVLCSKLMKPRKEKEGS